MQHSQDPSLKSPTKSAKVFEFLTGANLHVNQLMGPKLESDIGSLRNIANVPMPNDFAAKRAGGRPCPEDISLTLQNRNMPKLNEKH